MPLRGVQRVLIPAVGALTVLSPIGASAQMLVWAATYNGTASQSDQAVRVIAAPDGIYVAGTSYDPALSTVFTVLRYSHGGELIWVRNYAGPGLGADKLSDLVAHPTGGIIVAGYTLGGGGRQVAAVHYSSTGELVWARLHDVSGTVDTALGPRLAIGPGATVHLSGVTAGDFLALAYGLDGTPLWHTQIDLSAGGHDTATDIAAGPDGAVYLVGFIGDGLGGFATVRLDAAGSHDWTYREFGPLGTVLGPAFVEVAPDGGAVASAVPESQAGQALTQTWKLAPDGALLWTRSFPPNAYETVEAVDLAVGRDGSVVVLTRSWRFDDPGVLNFGTLKYDPGGGLLWWRSLDAGSSSDTPAAMTLDPAGNIFMTGDNRSGIVTASYSPAGTLRWTTVFKPGPDRRAADLARTSRGEIVVTGSFYDPYRWEDIFSLMYRQCPVRVPAR